MPPDDNKLQIWLALYNVTQNEITRYRDREWANTGLFTAAIAAVVTFIITKQEIIIARSLDIYFHTTLVLLSLGNIGYSLYAHYRLTEQRNIKKRIEYLLMNCVAFRVGNHDLLPYDIPEPEDGNFRKGWFKGFYGHLLPFFIAGILLASFGIYQAYRGNPYGGHLRPFILFIIILVLCSISLAFGIYCYERNKK